MILSRYNLKNIQGSRVVVPDDHLFDLPETVLQFGTGGLLRGLPGYFIDKANREGCFNGRIVVVKSTDGDSASFDRQDGMYTHCIRGLDGQQLIEQNIINSSISRVLSAKHEWQQVLECAHNLQLKLIISNTSEAGIQLVNEDVRKHPPASFPGKLLAVLYERFKAFEGSDQSGMIIIPTELIVDNGKKLEAIVLELAHLNGLEDAFIEWLETSNHFCNSLVDCNVPGAPGLQQRTQLEEELGYHDDLLIITEAYRLWAIEADAHIESMLHFGDNADGIFITSDLYAYQQLKLRLYNGAQILSCAIGHLSGSASIKDAMDNKLIAFFISKMVKNEISHSMPMAVPEMLVKNFADKVLDRFRNPYIANGCLNLLLQSSMKIKMSVVPVLIGHFERQGVLPRLVAFGFAAYILFMRSIKQTGNSFFGSINGKEYLIQDDKAVVLARHWKKLNIPDVVMAVLQDSQLWGRNLSAIPGLSDLVSYYLLKIVGAGIEAALSDLQAEYDLTMNLPAVFPGHQ